MRTSGDVSWTAVLLVAGLVVVFVAGMIVFGSGWTMPFSGGHMAGGHMGSSTDSAGPPVAGATTVEVVASDMAFDPALVTIPQAEEINIRLRNSGQAFHDLTIPALGFVLGAEAGETVTGSLRVAEAGTYEFVCSVPGHEAAGMRGELVVEPPAD